MVLLQLLHDPVLDYYFNISMIGSIARINSTPKTPLFKKFNRLEKGKHFELNFHYISI